MKFIAYLRVSTKKQDTGLDAQEKEINNYVSSVGGSIISTYLEKESGKDKRREKLSNRPKLLEALAESKRTGATIIVQKVDRLTRDIEDGAHIYKNYNVLFCDRPNISSLELGVFLGMAQQEREFISKRTKAALAVKKAQGVKLGGVYQPENLKKAQQAKHDLSKTTAQRQAFSAIELMVGTLRQKADRLNELGYTTPKGGQWTAIQVSRLIAKFNA